MAHIPLQVGKKLCAIVDGSNVSSDRRESLIAKNIRGKKVTFEILTYRMALKLNVFGIPCDDNLIPTPIEPRLENVPPKDSMFDLIHCKASHWSLNP